MLSKRYYKETLLLSKLAIKQSQQSKVPNKNDVCLAIARRQEWPSIFGSCPVAEEETMSSDVGLLVVGVEMALESRGGCSLECMLKVLGMIG